MFRRFLTRALLAGMVIAMALGGLGLAFGPSRAAGQPRAPRGATGVGASTRPGAVVQIPNCVQAPPQSVKDRATYTAGELARYGLPPRAPNEPFAKWARVVRGAGKSDCSYVVGAAKTFAQYSNPAWTGDVADESKSGQHYTETDMDFFVSCITGSAPNGASAEEVPWIGLGGYYYGGNLIQAGVDAVETGSSATYRVWVENLAASDPDPIYFDGFNLTCGTHLYVKAWDSGSLGRLFVMRISDGYNTRNQCYGPKSDEQSAEAIVEYPSKGHPNFANGDPYFADFQPQVFRGVGITDNGYYDAMNQVPYDSAVAFELCTLSNHTWINCKGDQLASVGPIGPVSNDAPGDQYTVYWQHYS
jgi:hypothetical protein